MDALSFAYVDDQGAIHDPALDYARLIQNR